MRFSFNGQRTDITTGWNLDSEEAWDTETQMVKAHYCGSYGETANEINASLQIKKAHLDMAFKYYEANDLIPTPQDVVKRYEERLKGALPKRPDTEPQPKTKTLSFFDVYNKFIEETGEKNTWTVATYQKMASLQEDLRSFKKNLSFSDLSESGLSSFIRYLRDDKRLRTPRKKKGERKEYDAEDITGLKNSTIEKKIDCLKWFLKWATERGYNSNLAYRSFRPTLKSTQKKVIFLTREELNKVSSLVFPKDKLHLEAVRDVFLFCCFSGLRHSDVYNLKRNDIKGDHIEITTVKTADSIMIELNKVTSRILEKYKDISFPDNRALPVLKNQPMNRELKDLCELAGIDEEIRVTTYRGNQRIDEIKKKYELVGTHTGRRTFIVNALSLGIAPNVVMKWTGHSDYKSMKPYIDIVDAIKANAMTKMDSLVE